MRYFSNLEVPSHLQIISNNNNNYFDIQAKTDYVQHRRQWNAWQGVVPRYIRYFCFAWQFIKFVSIFYLCTRQHKVLNQRRRIPRVFVGKLPPETFEQARAYHKALNYLKMGSCLYWMIHEVFLIYMAGYTYMWFLSGPILERLGFWPKEWDSETGESIIFVLLMVLHRNLAHLPIDLWKTFVIEESYGFNKLTSGTFFLDWLKKTLLEFVYYGLYGIFILWIVRATGTYFFAWVGIFSFLWLMTTLAVYPNFIAPIFDEYTPLREGRLQVRLRKLANFLGFPLEDILVLHQSWRSEHRKAYFFGLLGAKRIVLYDTLLTGYPEADRTPQRRLRTRAAVPKNYDRDSLQAVPSRILRRATLQMDNASSSSRAGSSTVGGSRELLAAPPVPRTSTISRKSMYDMGFTEFEIEAIVARMMGHWVLGHSVKELILPVISMFLFFFIFSYLYENSSLFQAFAFPKELDKPILLGLRLLYMDVMDIYIIFVESVIKHLNRESHFEADAFATKLGYGEDLIDAYIEAEKENLDYPYYDSWYWNFHYNQPSVLSSISEIELEMERMNWKVD